MQIRTALAAMLASMLACSITLVPSDASATRMLTIDWEGVATTFNPGDGAPSQDINVAARGTITWRFTDDFVSEAPFTVDGFGTPGIASVSWDLELDDPFLDALFPGRNYGCDVSCVLGYYGPDMWVAEMLDDPQDVVASYNCLGCAPFGWTDNGWGYSEVVWSDPFTPTDVYLSGTFSSVHATLDPIPEPSGALLMGLGLAVWGGRYARMRRPMY